MNPTIDLLCAHRSVRSFTDEAVPEGHLREAIRAGQMASTSSAVQACCAIEVTDRAVQGEIAELAGNQRYAESAPAFLLFCGDSRRHRLACAEGGGPGYDARLEAFLITCIDTALFAQNTAVALESMGYGICYIGGLRNDLPRLDALLGLPEGVYPFFGMCIGRPNPAKPGATRPRLPVEAALMRDRYHEDEASLAAMRVYDEVYREYLRGRGAPAEQVEAGWLARMASMHGTPRRPDLASYYARKGARLD